MGPTVTSLISIGLCVDWAVRAQTDSLPRPILWAVPSPVVRGGAIVTLRCQGHLGSERFQLWKDGELRDERNASWQQAEFVLRNVDDSRDARSYSCRSGQGSLWSKLSEPLALVVTGKFPRPKILAQPGLVMIPGANITLWCSRPKLSSLEEVTFTLWKAGTQKPLQNQDSADLWTSFLLPSVRPEDTGTYSCTYRERRVSSRRSEASEALELVVPGSLPKPSLSALPGLVVEPGMHVTLQCWQPPQTFLSGLTFTLLKVGTPQPLQSQSPTGTSVDFPLLSVRAQDAGKYSCVYYGRMAPYQVSETSEVLEIWVTDGLPKPFLSAWPIPEVASGSDMTFLCQGPSRGPRFVLYKEGDEKNLPSMDTSQGGAQFFLTQVHPKHSGNYSCRYQINSNRSLWSQHSEPLQLIVTGSVPSNALLITLSCVSFILLLLCLLFLAIICQRSIPVESSQGHSPSRCLCCPCLPWSTCLPQHPEVPRGGVLYAEVAKERPRESSVPMVEGSQGVTYTQLNIRTLNKRKANTEETPIEHTLYATVALK
ncbi:immunoglobulin superfamily member 1-like [Trichosurus vulpecula]|uniref:immunoglobulin superfamily member 1-like n=1 Tax=Trichosurus vulpecula TaxID=9337 RepID=UPI00186B2F3A|nr:immunoglobulin superfamily member 1-like [Trichosurus vulpecula]